jgi:hypothetical protein
MDVDDAILGHRRRHPFPVEVRGAATVEPVDPVDDPRPRRGEAPVDLPREEEVLQGAGSAPLFPHRLDGPPAGPSVLERAHRLDKLGQRGVCGRRGRDRARLGEQ